VVAEKEDRRGPPRDRKKVFHRTMGEKITTDKFGSENEGGKDARKVRRSLKNSKTSNWGPRKKGAKTGT